MDSEHVCSQRTENEQVELSILHLNRTKSPILFLAKAQNLKYQQFVFYISILQNYLDPTIAGLHVLGEKKN